MNKILALLAFTSMFCFGQNAFSFGEDIHLGKIIEEKTEEKSTIYQNVFTLGEDIQQLEKECDSKNYDSCEKAAKLYVLSSIVADYDKAFKYGKMACDNQKIEGCSIISILYYAGRGVEEDYDKAAESYEKACSDKNSVACYNLNLWFDQMYGGNAAEQNDEAEAEYHEKTTFKHYKQGCDNNDFFACFNLGLIYEIGWGGIKINFKRAFEYYKQGCDGKEANSCLYLGFMYKMGRGVKQDTSQADKYFDKACDLGAQIACE